MVKILVLLCNNNTVSAYNLHVRYTTSYKVLML